MVWLGSLVWAVARWPMTRAVVAASRSAATRRPLCSVLRLALLSPRGRSVSFVPVRGPPAVCACQPATRCSPMWSNRGRHGRAYGFERAMDSFGAIVGPLLAIGLVAAFGTRTAIGLSAIPGLAAAVAIVYAIQFPSAEGKVVPDEDHVDAAGQPDDDQAGAELGEIGEEQPGQGERQGRPDHPTEDEGEGDGPSVGRDGADASVTDLGQDRVHHGQQADGDRQRDGADLHLVEPVVEVREGTTEEQAAGHGQSDPQWQQPVQGRQAGSDVPVNRGEGRGHRCAAVDVTLGLTWLPTACASS